MWLRKSKCQNQWLPLNTDFLHHSQEIRARPPTCGKAVLSCLCSESLSWLTSCSLPCVKPRFSWVSLNVSRSRSRSSSMDTMRDSKWPSESDCNGEPEPRRPLLTPPPGPSASLIVGITSHIIYGDKKKNREQKIKQIDNNNKKTQWLTVILDSTVSSQENTFIKGN